MLNLLSFFLLQLVKNHIVPGVFDQFTPSQKEVLEKRAQMYRFLPINLVVYTKNNFVLSRG